MAVPRDRAGPGPANRLVSSGARSAYLRCRRWLDLAHRISACALSGSATAATCPCAALDRSHVDITLRKGHFDPGFAEQLIDAGIEIMADFCELFQPADEQAAARNSSVLSPNLSSTAVTGGSRNTRGRLRGLEKQVSACGMSEPNATPTRITVRRIVSERVQLINWPVMNSLFGTISSLRSPSVIVVARIRIRVTVPLMPPIVTVSPSGASAARRG